MSKTENNYLIYFLKKFAFFPIFPEKRGRDRVTAREIGPPRHERATAVARSTPRFYFFNSSSGTRDLTLPCHPGIKLPEAKLKSLSKKYFSIPKQFLDYCPKYKNKDKPKDPIIKRIKKRKRESDNPLKRNPRKVGRPKKLRVILTGMKSITNYFRTK